MKPTAMLKDVDSRAVNNMITPSLFPSTFNDNLLNSKEVIMSIMPTMNWGKEVNMFRRLLEKNIPSEISIRPSIKIAPPVLAPNRYWAANPPDP